MTQKRVVPIDGSTVSHHAIITLANLLSYAAVASCSHRRAFSGYSCERWWPVCASLGQNRPGDTGRLVASATATFFAGIFESHPRSVTAERFKATVVLLTMEPAEFAFAALYVRRRGADAPAARSDSAFVPSHSGSAANHLALSQCAWGRAAFA